MVNRLCDSGKQRVTQRFTMIAMELSITDAAQTLGISPNTVRRRLTSGLLTGNKVDGKWFINVADTGLPRSAPPQTESADTALVQHLEALITAQEVDLSAKNAEINHLRGMLGARLKSRIRGHHAPLVAILAKGHRSVNKATGPSH